MPNARALPIPDRDHMLAVGDKVFKAGVLRVPAGERMTRPVTPAAAMFKGASGNTLVGDVYGEEGPPVLLLHGGGQTRHAWKKTGDLIARMGRDRLRGRSARPRRFRMGRQTAPTNTPTSPPTRGCWPIRWPSEAACGRRWSALRSAAWRR